MLFVSDAARALLSVGDIAAKIGKDPKIENADLRSNFLVVLLLDKPSFQSLRDLAFRLTREPDRHFRGDACKLCAIGTNDWVIQNEHTILNKDIIAG